MTAIYFRSTRTCAPSSAKGISPGICRLFFIDILNEKTGFQSKVVLCQPIALGLDLINEQEGLYTLYLRGFQNGQKSKSETGHLLRKQVLKPIQDYEEVLACLQRIQISVTSLAIQQKPESSTILPASSQILLLPAIQQSSHSSYTVDSRNLVQKQEKDL